MNDFILPQHEWTQPDSPEHGPTEGLFPGDEPAPPPTPHGGVETATTLASVLEPANVEAAWQKVRRNKGCAGVDGWRISQIEKAFALNWQPVADAVVSGRWQPQPLMRVDIPKVQGGSRTLAIPSVMDRVLLQAISQVLAPVWQAHFSPQSFAYTPGRSALQAVEYARAGFLHTGASAWHLDIADFFDSVPHLPLLEMLAQGGADPPLVEIIGRSLQAPLVGAGRIQARPAGVPQGSPLSPLLANIYLTPFDSMQADAGRPFARYADDILVFPASGEAPTTAYGDILLQMRSLGLELNQEKTRLAPAEQTQFLGYGYWNVAGAATPDLRLRVAPDSLAAACNHLELLSRPGPDAITSEDRRAAACQFLRGWLNYYQATENPEDVPRILATARQVHGITPEQLWPGSMPGPAASAAPAPHTAYAPHAAYSRTAWTMPGMPKFTASQPGAVHYAGQPQPLRHPLPAPGEKLALVRHWAGRMLRNGTVRCGLELGSQKGSWIPKPSAFRVTILGHSIKFKL